MATSHGKHQVHWAQFKVVLLILKLFGCFTMRAAFFSPSWVQLLQKWDGDGDSDSSHLLGLSAPLSWEELIIGGRVRAFLPMFFTRSFPSPRRSHCEGWRCVTQVIGRREWTASQDTKNLSSWELNPASNSSVYSLPYEPAYNTLFGNLLL